MGPKQKQWIEALRSGDYRQGRNVLCYNKKYCCLGVANELFSLGMKSQDTALFGDSHTKLGLRSPHGSIMVENRATLTLFPNGELYDSLASANDDGVPFSDIADFIEANPEKLFTHDV